MSSAKIRVQNSVCTIQIGEHTLAGTHYAVAYYNAVVAKSRLRFVGEGFIELDINLRRKKNGFYYGNELFCKLPRDDDFPKIERRLKKLVQLIYERGWELRCARQVYGSQPEVGIEA